MATVAVAGISGKLGQLIVQSLLSHDGVSVQGLCRDKSKLPQSILANPNITLVEGRSDDLNAARKAVQGCSVVICCYLGSNELMTQGQKVLIDACVAEKVPRYIPSDYTLDYRPIRPTDIPSKEPMFHIIDYLRGKPITGVHVMIGCFLETFWNFLGIWNPTEYSLSFWGTGDEKWDLTTYETAAQYVANVALDKTAVGFVKFRGDFITLNEIAKVLKERYGSLPRIKNRGTLQDLLARCDEAREGDPLSPMNQPLFYQYYIQNGSTLLGDDLDGSRYPSVKPVSVKEFVFSNDVKSMGKW